MALPRLVVPKLLIGKRLRVMSTSTSSPSFLGFHLALIQLGQIGSDKAKNLKHAYEMVQRAASGDNGKHPKPDLVVLPVGTLLIVLISNARLRVC